MKEILELIKEFDENKDKELKSFDQLVDYYQSYNERNLVLGEIGPELAVAVDSVIRFWNKMDENVPVKERLPIKIYIHSPGGYLTSAFSIIETSISRILILLND